MTLKNIRLLNQQLIKPEFNHPEQLVSWMGAMQAQNYTMAKWAIGIRLASGTLEAVEESLRKGEILRTHVMRPTWHFVAAKDIRWMLQLSCQRVKAAFASYANTHQLEMSTELYLQGVRILEKMLEGNNSLTKQEIAEGFSRHNFELNDHRVTYFLAWTELDGIVCSGVDKGSKTTYALLDERVPPTKELAKDEALAHMARNYFQSHSPASLADFVWWSGLTMSEARQAISSIESEMTRETSKEQVRYIHSACRTSGKVGDSCLLLPSFDEYLISYKDRTDVLPLEHHPKAFNNFGTFYPVLLHNGAVVGNWSVAKKKKEVRLEHTCFEPETSINQSLLERAKKQYETYLFT